MSHYYARTLAIAGAAAALGGFAPAQAASFTPFSFTSNVSSSGLFTDGDVRLDSLTIGATTLQRSQLQTVSAATIVIDDGVDVARGGHNLASGQGISSPLDSWETQGPATITPVSADLKDSLANFNLTSIVVTRENVGTATVDVSFAAPTNRFFFWERGGSGPNGNGNSDLLVEALDANDVVTGSYEILRENYAATGIEITTWNGSFASPSTPGGAQARLGSIGLEFSELTSKLRLTSVQTGIGIGDNGPDYKVIAASPVPVPGAVWLLGTAIAPLVLRGRRQTKI